MESARDVPAESATEGGSLTDALGRATAPSPARVVDPADYVHESSVRPERSPSTRSEGRGTNPFSEELPRILTERSVTMRALAREVGGLDHAYLSRMLRGRVPVNVHHARRIARYLRLPEDYFAEVREAAVVDAVRRRPRLRDEIYFKHVKRQAS